MIKFFKKNSGSICLILASAIWGTAFVAQTSAAESVESFTFNSARYLIAAVVLFIFVLIKGKAKKERTEKEFSLKTLIIYGSIIGAVLFLASFLQQYGISNYPDTVNNIPGRSGFLTAMYVVLVPLFGIFFKKKVTSLLWLAVALTVVALWLLCLKNGFKGIYLGDILTIGCALCFTAHIMLIDHISGKVDGVKLSLVQFFTAGILSLICGVIFESTPLKAILQAWVPILYVGVCSSAIGYTLQIIGQKKTAPAVASILMSLESVFAVLGGLIFFGEMMSLREISGCAIMFAAVILAQIPRKNDKEVAYEHIK